jgi:hypothetical protein
LYWCQSWLVYSIVVALGATKIKTISFPFSRAT